MGWSLLSDISWLGVLLGALLWFVLGAVWYMLPPIAQRWQQYGGIEVSDDDAPKPSIFILTFVAYFVAITVTSMLAVAVGVESAGQGACLGLAVGIGYALTAAAVTAIYDTKPNPFGWFWINGVFNVIGLTAAGAVVGIFA